MAAISMALAAATQEQKVESSIGLRLLRAIREMTMTKPDLARALHSLELAC
jgi:hypothetical protein